MRKKKFWMGIPQRNLRRIFFLAGAGVGVVVGMVGIATQIARDPSNWVGAGLFTLIFFIGIFLFGLAFGDLDESSY